MAYEVFFSSTRQDLTSFRDAVSLRLRKAGYVPIEMEAFGARNEEPLQACLQEVVEADLFIGVYAWRYGFVPAGSQISITEQELREAQRCRKPIFCFLLDETAAWPAELRETGKGAEQLAELKRRIREERICETFTTPDDLAAAVVAALQKWRDQQVQASLSPERKIQLALLDKVERFWIDGVLRRSVPEGRRLRIGRRELPQAVGRPELETPADAEAPAGAVEPIHDVFAQRGGSLLILGPPGGGKTITLLELAHALGKVAQRDPQEPVPVVFNLASWKGRHQSLASWMSDELAARYQAGKKPAAEWVEANQILPLLDGLDEVEPGCRPACLAALNAHLAERGLACRMAVCCHTQVYEELPARLRLEAAVSLQPLAPDQVDAHLAAGPSLQGLRAAVAADADLRELTSSPLMLILLERTWRDRDPALASSPEESPVERAFTAFVDRALEPQRELPWAVEERPRGWRDRLPWNRYRAGAAKPVYAAARYPLERTRSALAWLATGMAAHDPALFQVERLQPAWLAGPRQLWAYAILSRALGGTLLLLPPAILFKFAALLLFGFAAGALLGATDVLRLRRSGSQEASGKGRLVALAAGRIGLFMVEVLIPLFLVGALWQRSGPDGLIRSQMLSNLILTGLLVGPLFGLVFGVRGAGGSGSSDVRVAEALVWTRWSARGTRLGALWGLAVGVVVWALRHRDPSFGYFDVRFFLALATAFVLGGGILGGALGALGGRALEKKAWPNQGTWLALRNAGVVALAVAAATALVLYALLWTLDALRGQVPRRDLLWTPLKVGTSLGFWVGLWYSGLDFLQHFVLRLVLRVGHLVPGRLVGFLDYLTERGLLQRPGGSYKFFHPLLLRHFTREETPGNGR